MKSHGLRRGSRKVLKKKPRERGMQPLGRMLHEYTIGDKVVIKIDPSIHSGMPHHRYYGKVGIIVEIRGQAYVIKLKDLSKTRQLIARPEHLKPFFDIGGK